LEIDGAGSGERNLVKLRTGNLRLIYAFYKGMSNAILAKF